MFCALGENSSDKRILRNQNCSIQAAQVRARASNQAARSVSAVVKGRRVAIPASRTQPAQHQEIHTHWLHCTKQSKKQVLKY